MKIDENIINDLMKDTDENATYVSDLVDSLVSKCCSTLDKYIEYVSGILNDKDYEITNTELDDIIMTIPTLLYSVGVQQERLGIKQDVSESNRMLLYNKIYAETSGTASVKKSVADAELFNESLVIIVYKRAYDIIKSKISFSFEVLQSAKKVMTRRISEQDLTKVSTNRVSYN